jgi:hypothetical protein
MARYLTAGAWPMSWSEDGRSIYAYDMNTSKVVRALLDGSPPVVLGDLSNRRIALLPAVTRDGSHVVFSAHAIHSDVWLAEDVDPERK